MHSVVGDNGAQECYFDMIKHLLQRKSGLDLKNIGSGAAKSNAVAC